MQRKKNRKSSSRITSFQSSCSLIIPQTAKNRSKANKFEPNSLQFPNFFSCDYFQKKFKLIFNSKSRKSTQAMNKKRNLLINEFK